MVQPLLRVAQHQRQIDAIGPESLIRHRTRPDAVPKRPTERIDARLVGHADRPAQRAGDAHSHDEAGRDRVGRRDGQCAANDAVGVGEARQRLDEAQEGCARQWIVEANRVDSFGGEGVGGRRRSRRYGYT